MTKVLPSILTTTRRQATQSSTSSRWRTAIVEHGDVIQPVPDRRQPQHDVLTKEKAMSKTNKDIAVAFYKKALFEGRVEDAFRLYAVPTYRQHNPLIEDGMEGVKKFVTWIMSNHPDASGEIKRVFS
jgi:predicted SnoaL-like aldol condensation-catalyzing enzyme